MSKVSLFFFVFLIFRFLSFMARLKAWPSLILEKIEDDVTIITISMLFQMYIRRDVQFKRKQQEQSMEFHK